MTQAKQPASPLDECIEEITLDYLHRGKLGAAEAAAVSKHLEACQKCRRLSDEIGEEVEFGTLIREAEPNLSPEQQEQIVRKSLASKRKPDDQTTETR